LPTVTAKERRRASLTDPFKRFSLEPPQQWTVCLARSLGAEEMADKRRA
jgi:hypothetical protein